jgi:hypothetical protein
MTIDNAYEAKHSGLVLGEAVDLRVVGVRPSGRFARKGGARALFRRSAEVGRKRNLGRRVTECTGYYSQTAAKKASFMERERPGLPGLPLRETSGIRQDRTPAHRGDFLRTGV